MLEKIIKCMMSNSTDKEYISYLVFLLVFIQLMFFILSGQIGSKGGLEMTDIAERIALGHGFASPYMPIGEGEPTRVSPPLYVGIIAATYSVLGIKTFAANVFLQILNVVFNAVTLIALFRVCQRLLGTLSARVFAIMFTLHPSMMFLSETIWESCLTLMLLSLLLHYLLFQFRKTSYIDCCMFGGLLGLIALSNPAWTFSYPFICLAVYWNESFKRFIVSFLPSVSVIFISYCLVISPWLARNYMVTNEVGYVRSMTGPELFKGNNSDSMGGHGQGFVDYFIYSSAVERQRYQRMGEIEYDKYMTQRATSEIVHNPDRFLKLTLYRVLMWWSGDIDLLNWYISKGDTAKLVFGSGVTLANLLTSILAFLGFWALRGINRKFWLVWIFAFVLPIPYYFIIVGFRYQASTMAFVLIPAAYYVSWILSAKIPSLLNDLSSPALLSDYPK